MPAAQHLVAHLGRASLVGVAESDLAALGDHLPVDDARVVRGERRVEGDRIGKQSPRAGEIRDVGRRLARKYRVVSQAALLRELDFGVPVRAFHQSYHQAPPGTVREVGEPVDGRQRALLVRLQRNAQAVPAGEFVIERERFDEVERDFQPIHFFRIDGETDVHALSLQRQRLDRRPQLAAHAFFVGHLVARMQRRELDRHRRRFKRRPTLRGGADDLDRRHVGLEVFERVAGGARRFAEHVVAVAVAVLFRALRARYRFVDVAAHDELLAENAHRRNDRLPDHRLAGTRHEAFEGTAKITVVVFQIDDAPGEHQRPGAGIDEQAVRGTEALFPFGIADLVADQQVHRLGIGDAQERLGHTHQDDALARREVVGIQEGIEAADLEAAVAHVLHQRPGAVEDALLFFGGKAGAADEFVDDCRLVDAVSLTHRLAQRAGVFGSHAVSCSGKSVWRPGTHGGRRDVSHACSWLFSVAAGKPDTGHTIDPARKSLNFRSG